MTPPFVTFDLEIYKDLDPANPVYLDQGISCAAIAWRNYEGTICTQVWQSPAGCAMGAPDVYKMLATLEDIGRPVVTWNGCSFDFRVLAIESVELDRCRALTRQSHDPMFELLCRVGYPLALNTACVGMGTSPKVHEVILKSGETLTKMEGSQAPALYRAGEVDAVVEYLKGDVISLLELTEQVYKTHCLQWISKKGRPMFQPMELLTVEQCLKLPLPDTSWMKEPMTRSKFAGWLDHNISEVY